MYSIVTIADQTGDPARDLTTVEDVLLEIGGGDDGTIADQISLYSKIIASYCEREFAKELVVETFRLQSCEQPSVLPLNRYPVEEIYSVTIDGDEIDQDNYEIDPPAGLLHYIDGAWSGKQVAVTYVAGYDLPDDAPAPLSRACVLLVKDGRAQAGRDTSIRAIEDDGSRVEYNISSASSTQSTLPIGVAELLEPFRRMTV